MQVSQTRGVQQYIAVSKTTQATESADKLKEQGQGGESAAQTDRVELSADAKITKMSDSERAALVESLKAEQEMQMDRFINMMTQMFNKQGMTAAVAQGDSFWQMFASGDLTVDAQTKAEAQAAISEDGYWGVKQTSERIFTMALALSGGDEAMMQKMQAAVEKGFEQATKAWGSKLPSITDDTHEAINKMFSDYYDSLAKTEETESTATEETKPAEPAEKEAEDTEEKQGGSVAFNAAKRARQLAAAASRSDVQAVLALLNQDLSECKAGLERGWCDEAEVAKVEAMLQQAAQRMTQFGAEQEDQEQGGVDAFALASLM